MPTLGERFIWKGYEYAAMAVPTLLMLSHWAIFYVFSQNNKEVMRYPVENEICIAWIFVFMFFIFPLGLLPATYLYRRCGLYRIPFLYFIFVNVERWYYGSYFCTNEMVDTHYILIYCILTLYVFEVCELAFVHLGDIVKFFGRLFAAVGRWTVSLFRWFSVHLKCEDGLTEEERDKVFMMIDEENRKGNQKHNKEERQ